MRRRFEDVCNLNAEWGALTIERRDTLVRRMERNCFEVVIRECTRDGIDRLFTDKKFVDRYSSVCSRVLANLDPTVVDSPYLITRLISGEIDPYAVAEMTSYELCPSASATERSRIELRRAQRAANKVSRAHTCMKCGCNETTYIEFQRRAVDEGSSKSIKCAACSYVWQK